MNSIYKYTAYRPAFFENFFLRLSRFGDFNDPFEMVLGNYLASIGQEEYNAIIEMASHLSDPDSFYNFAIDAQCGVRAWAGIMCFTSKKDNLLMWSHYASNHEGICIEFDGSSDFFNGKYTDACEFFGSRQKDHYENIGQLRKVDYKNERPSYMDPGEIEYNTESWFVKSLEWSYEEELRLILPIDLAKGIENSDMLFYPVEPKIIKSIILGCRMSIDNKKEIFAKCKEYGIKVYEAFIHSHKFELEIVEYAESNHNSYQNMFNLNRISSW